MWLCSFIFEKAYKDELEKIFVVDLLASIWLFFFFSPVVTASLLRLDSSVFTVLLLQVGCAVSFLKKHVMINLSFFVKLNHFHLKE